MNERIRELAERAGMRTISYEQDEDTHFADIIDIEKFAELIIKECIAQVEKDHFGGRESWDRSIDNSVNNIKYHFGVE